MRFWPVRVSLLGRFTAMGLLVVAALGLALGLLLKRQIEHRALEQAVGTARVIAQVGVQSHLWQGDLRYPVSLERLNALDAALQTRFFADNGVARVKLYNRDRRLVYSSERTDLGDHGYDHVARALRGEVLRELTTGEQHDGTGEQLLGGLRAAAPGSRRAPGGRARGLHVLRRRRRRHPPRRARALRHARRRARRPLRRPVPDRRRRLRTAAAPGPARRPHRPPQPHAAAPPRRPGAARGRRGARSC